MIAHRKFVRLGLTACVLAGTGLLSACGGDSPPVTTSQTTTTTTGPAPMVPASSSTTTVTHTQAP